MSLELIVFLAASLAGGVLASCVIAAARLRRRQRGEVWRAVAERRGARIDADREQLVMRLGDALITIEDVGVGATRVRAEYPVAAGPWFVLHRADPSARVPTGLGALYPEIPAGVRRLDTAYVLRSPDGDAARVLWSASAAAALATTFPDAHVVGDARGVSIEIPRPLRDARLIDAAIDLAAELGNVDLFGLGAVRALPRAEDRGGVAGRACVTVDLAGAFVHFRPTLTDGGVSTVAWIEGVSADDATAPSALGNGTLTATENEVQFTWNGIERDASRLMAAAHFLAGLVERPAPAPYR